MPDYITREQLCSWWERLTFIKNEVQSELDVQLDQDPELVKLNEALQNTKAQVLKVAETKNLKLF